MSSSEDNPRFVEKGIMRDINQIKPEKAPTYKPMTVKKKQTVVEKQRKNGQKIMQQHQTALRAWETFFYMEEEESSDDSDEKPYYKEVVDGRIVYRYTKPIPDKK